MKLSRSKNVYKLEIQNATVEDSGKYTVKAKNQFGQCSATASLNVLGKFCFSSCLFGVFCLVTLLLTAPCTAFSCEICVGS